MGTLYFILQNITQDTTMIVTYPNIRGWSYYSDFLWLLPLISKVHTLPVQLKKEQRKDLWMVCPLLPAVFLGLWNLLQPEKCELCCRRSASVKVYQKLLLHLSFFRLTQPILLKPLVSSKLKSWHVWHLQQGFRARCHGWRWFSFPAEFRAAAAAAAALQVEQDLQSCFPPWEGRLLSENQSAQAKQVERGQIDPWIGFPLVVGTPTMQTLLFLQTKKNFVNSIYFDVLPPS